MKNTTMTIVAKKVSGCHVCEGSFVSGTASKSAVEGTRGLCFRAALCVLGRKFYSQSNKPSYYARGHKHHVG
jgi:hypothetical protein